MANKFKVLLTEDDRAVGRSIKLGLGMRGCDCLVVESGAKAFEVALKTFFDVIVLDLMLPDADGYEVLAKIRAMKVRTPIIVLSGLSSPDWKVKAFKMGADDYVHKPFDDDELFCRLEAVRRRYQGQAGLVTYLNDLSCNMDTRKVKIRGNHVPLTGKEYIILEYLLLKRSTVVTKDALYERLYDCKPPNLEALKIIDVFVCKLRKKLSDLSGGTEYITTIWGKGYVIDIGVGGYGIGTANFTAPDFDLRGE